MASLRCRRRMKFRILAGLASAYCTFFGQVGIAVLPDRDVIDIGNLRAHGIQASLDRQAREIPRSACIRFRRSSAMANTTSPSCTMAAEASA